MQPFTVHQGLAVPLLLANVDTDVIVRIERCAQFARDALGPWAFESLRYLADGKKNPDCVFNRPGFQGASILLAGENFGCGSSREMAVWALAGMGMRCVIAPSFGDIFYANCFQNGLLPVRLPTAAMQALRPEAEAGTLQLEIDLAAQAIRGATTPSLTFEIEPLRKTMLLQGRDEISMTLLRENEITQWQERDRLNRPWAWLPVRV